MGSTLVWILLVCFALAIAQAIVRRLLNPFAEIDYGELAAPLRVEVERVLPGFVPQRSRQTRHGDEVRVDGEWRGRPIDLSARLDAAGELIEFEAEAPGSLRTRDRASREALPSAAAAEIDRILGEPVPVFERTGVTSGTVGDEPHFELKGYARDWKWEVVVSADGRLHEVERERRTGSA